jgi:hypothetical protein
LVSVIVAEVGENIRAGQPVLAIKQAGKQLLSFNVREDFLHGIAGTRGPPCRAEKERGECFYVGNPTEPFARSVVL